MQEVKATINGKPVENGKTYRFTEPGWHTYRIEVKDFAGWKTVYEEKFEVYIPVRFTLAPDSLQLDHGSGMATAFAELPEPFAPEQIRFSTVQLNGQTVHVQDDHYWYVRNPITDSDENGIAEMMFKYERESLVQVIPPGAPKWTQARLTLFGEWNQYHIKGYDEIRVNNSGYVPPPPDVTAPALTSDPADGTQAVAVSAAPILTFSETVAAMSGAELTDAAVADSLGQSVPVTANWKKNSRTIQVTPSREWAGDTTFTFEFAERMAQDAAGNANGLYRFSFRTAVNPLVFAPPLPVPVIEVESDSGETPDPVETPGPIVPPAQASPGGPMPEPVQVLGSVSGQALSEAIRAGQATGQITLEALEGRLAFDLAQLQQLAATGLPLKLNVADVVFTLRADILQTEDLRDNSVSHVALGAELTPPALSEELKAKATELERYQLQGEIRHFQAILHLKDHTEKPMTTFKGSMKVGIPLEPEMIHLAEMGILQIGRFHEGKKTWEIMPGRYDAKSGLFLFETEQFSHWALMSKTIKTFSDISDHWARSVIEGMATNGRISGVGGGLFAPDNAMTRAEVATLLDRLLDGEGVAESPFADVPKNEWFTPAVDRMYAAGLVAGVDANRFAPYETVTREQLAVMIARALSPEQSGGGASLDLFADQSGISPWAREAVGVAAQLGIVRGMAEENQVIFAPQKAVTRAEAVTMLKKFLDVRQ